MRNLFRSILIIVFLLIVQLATYNFFLKPIITTWGASKQEILMPMAGDSHKLNITSTRAILINAPKEKVWNVLAQLGADRAGFYSYGFIEEAMGYHQNHHYVATPESQTIKVGEIVRGSINPKSSLIPYNFPVTYVKAGDTFVLKNWGTFLVQKVNTQQTRLIIRTQVPRNRNLGQKIADYVAIPLHYLMERGTLIGVKASAEAKSGGLPSQMNNMLWFGGIVLSGLLIAVLIFIGRGVLQSIVIPLFASWFWLLSLLIFSPIPIYGVALLLSVITVILSVVWKG